MNGFERHPHHGRPPLWCTAAALVALLLGAAGHASGEMQGISIGLKPVADGFEAPLHLTNADDNSNRLFVVEQAGRIYSLQDGHRQPFLDIRDRVASGGEKGLLSLAFHPRFASNGRFFVNYTRGNLLALETVVSEYRIDSSGQANPESERIILRVDQPYPNHNGGQIAFGPDGDLYVGMGDGGWANDPHNHGQRLDSLLGAMLRIDIDRQEQGAAYAIPRDNPFIGRAGARKEIWAYGLRNPWRFSFDSATGALYAGDVGQDDREEINRIEKGGNYGWRIMEGSICTPGVNPACDRQGLAPPLTDYDHEEGVSVIGGFVYRGSKIDALNGLYLFADWGSGRIWGLDPATGRRTLLLKTDLNISAFGIDAQHELYVVDHSGGGIYRLTAAE